MMTSLGMAVSLLIALQGMIWSATDSGVLVKVTGRAVGTTPAAEEEARLDALREAVLRACGSFINAQTETQDFAVVRDKVLEQPVGFARVVRVIKGPERIQDFTQIQLEAEVFPAKFERRWAEFAHIKQREGNPRCVVVIVEDDDPYDANPPITSGLVQSELENFFLSKKVQLMDKGISDDVRTRDLNLAAQSGDVNKAAAAGAAFKADVVVLGQVEAKRGDSVILEGHEVKRWNVPLTVRVIQTDSGAILVSKTYRPKEMMTTTGSGKDALLQVAKDSAPAVLTDIGKAWRERATAGRTIQMTLQPCTRKQFRAIQAQVIQMKGITGGEDGFALRELVNDVATIDVNWKYGLNQLADRLEELSVSVDGGTVGFEVAEQSANRITVRLRAKAAASPATRPTTQPARPSSGE